MRVTFLGTATSHGLPYVGCTCDVCTSDDPHNQRLRCSILVENGAGQAPILVDTSPDLRQQLLRARVESLEAVLWTHSHNDHFIGLDDLRRITDVQGYLDGYCSAATLAHLERVFDYAFVQERSYGGFPRVTPHVVTAYQTFALDNCQVTAIPIMHGAQEIFAYRFTDGKSTFTYATDCSLIPDRSLEYLANADVLVLDALRLEPHPTHFSLDKSLEAIAILQPKRAYLTHFAHEMDHESISARLPENVEMAYDMLEVEV